MKAQILAVLLVVGTVSASEWWDVAGMFSGDTSKPVFAKMQPALQNGVPASVQKHLQRITPKDLMGLRALAEHMTQHPTSRQEFVKQMGAKSPNVMHLGTELYKLGNDAFQKQRKTLSTDTIKFLRAVATEAQAAVADANKLYSTQDAATKKNLQTVFPFMPTLLSSAQNSAQYVAKNI